MKNILAVTFANLRKNKSQAVSLLAFALIAALLLNLGLLLMLRYGNYFSRRSEELNAPHYVLIEEKRLYKQSQTDYIKNYPAVTEVETEPALAVSQTDLPYNDGNIIVSVIFLNADAKRTMNDLTLIEGSAPRKTDEICLPYLFKAGGGYEIGDPYVINIDGVKFNFKICGFTEEIAFGAATVNVYQTYLSASGYDALLDKNPELECMILRARLQNPALSDNLLADCAKEFFFMSGDLQAGPAFYKSISWNSMNMARTMMSGVTSSIMVVFAMLIVFISMLVIRFRIRNSIEESMTNIGALKAVGYTGVQLLWATILQFCAIAVIGTLAGIGISYAALPPVSQILEEQTALQWNQGFDLASSLISLTAIMLIALAVTWLSARHIRKLQPLAALRQGLAAHSFKRNRFPLDRSKGPLTLILALKSSLQAKGQLIMIFIIVAAISFMAVAGISVYSNIGLHPDVFGRLISGEIPDAAFILENPDDAQAVRDYIEKSGEARKVFYYQNLAVMINEMEINNIIVEDCGFLEGAQLYEGRYPRHDNEIAVGGSLSRREGVNIGDTVAVTLGGKTAEYLIVGLIQTMNDNGYACVMDIAGMHRIQPAYRPSELYVYMKDNTKTAGFIESVRSRFAAELTSTVNLQELMDTQLGVYGEILQIVAAAIVAVTVLVIVMVLYLMLKTVILRRRRELGIQKALGFTTFQLMNQFALHFIPVVALGVAAGGLAGIFGFNSLFLALVRGMGIMTASMPAPLAMTIALCIGLILAAYVFAMLISWRIRKISAYALVSE